MEDEFVLFQNSLLPRDSVLFNRPGDQIQKPWRGLFPYEGREMVRVDEVGRWLDDGGTIMEKDNGF